MRHAIVPLLVLAAIAAELPAQTAPEGRFALFGGWAERESEGSGSSNLSELIASLSIEPPRSSLQGFDYALDLRVATFPSGDRDERISLYEAWVGFIGGDRRWSLRLGQMWVDELGGIGSVGGILGEYRPAVDTILGTIRIGLFGGVEPDRFDAGWDSDVTKAGGYVAVHGDRGRRHVLGYVRMENDSVTERSVVVFNNFVPVGRKLFLYQAAEYDLEGPAGLGDSDLTYLFANLRYSPARIVQLQGTYHRGRSVDTRTITEDHLAGRPIPVEALDGFLFEATRVRVTVRPLRLLSVWVSWGHDRSNRDDEPRDRIGGGFSLRDILGAGFDLTATRSEIDHGSEAYDATYASLGRSFGLRLYLSLDYHQSLAIYVYDTDGGTVTVRPDTRRYAVSANANLGRRYSLLLTLEQVDGDGLDTNRALVGTTVRF